MTLVPEQAQAVAGDTPQRETASPPPRADSAELPETVISSDTRARLVQAMRDLWSYRDLFRAFVARDIKVRYRQTALGVVWVVLQPLVTAGILSMIFMRVRGSDAGAWNLLLAFLGALIPWTCFASAVQNSALSMESNAHLITKVYFPRMIIPGAFVCSSVLDFLIGFLILIGMAAMLDRLSPALIAMMPVLLTIQLVFAAACGLVLGSLNAQYRDIKYAVPFLLQIGMLATVLMPLDLWPPAIGAVLSFIPITAVVEIYRAILDGRPIELVLLAKAAAMSIVLLVAAVYFFRAREARMVDIL